MTPLSWWPGNVEVGGTHIHHLVSGILLLLIDHLSHRSRPDLSARTGRR